MGYVIGERGIRPLPERVEAVKHYQNPQNVSELHRFLGMINFFFQTLSAQGRSRAAPVAMPDSNE